MAFAPDARMRHAIKFLPKTGKNQRFQHQLASKSAQLTPLLIRQKFTSNFA